ncbi:MAG: hypothetical protein WCQ45_04970 [bacterium]
MNNHFDGWTFALSLVLGIGLLVGAMFLSSALNFEPAWKTMPRQEAISALVTVHPLWSRDLAAAVVDGVPERQAEQYPSWSASAHRLVAANKVELGMTREMVRVSVGSPNHIGRYLDSSGTAETWTYNCAKWIYGLGIISVPCAIYYFANDIFTARSISY